jgi:hypothetical protein
MDVSTGVHPNEYREHDHDKQPRNLRWHVLAVSEGSGSQALVATPVAVHVKACDAVVLAPPPIEYPPAQFVVTDAVVTPESVRPLVTPVPRVTVGHDTAAIVKSVDKNALQHACCSERHSACSQNIHAPWQEVVAGEGLHTLAAGPEAAQVKI